MLRLCAAFAARLGLLVLILSGCGGVDLEAEDRRYEALASDPVFDEVPPTGTVTDELGARTNTEREGSFFQRTYAVDLDDRPAFFEDLLRAAATAGWEVTRIDCDGDVLSAGAAKEHDGWTATLSLYVDVHDISNDAQLEIGAPNTAVAPGDIVPNEDFPPQTVEIPPGCGRSPR